MEFVLPDWFYQGLVDRRLVLTIDPAYFRLTGGVERWLYRVARKHAGRQSDGWRFDLRHLYAKSASQARLPDFALGIRRLAARQPLPGYRLQLERVVDLGGRVQDLLAFRPCGAADNIDPDPAEDRVFGRNALGTSGAAASGLRARAVDTARPDAEPFQQLTLGLEGLNAPTESNCSGVRPPAPVHGPVVTRSGRR